MIKAWCSDFKTMWRGSTLRINKESKLAFGRFCWDINFTYRRAHTLCYKHEMLHKRIVLCHNIFFGSRDIARIFCHNFLRCARVHSNKLLNDFKGFINFFNIELITCITITFSGNRDFKIKL